MELSPVFFYVFGALAIACALMVVLAKSPVTSAFSLILVFFAFAAIYAMLGAHLIAALQIIVYAGAIMVLFVFVIMLLDVTRDTGEAGKPHPILMALSVLAAMSLLAVFVWAFKNTGTPAILGPFTTEAITAAGGNTQVVSELMFSEYILPFELTSVLLLGAIIGTVAIAKRQMSAARKGGGK
ncbi:MAG: hypothetical protein A2X94_09225 [Bdellovibrionales bacterium GWB1_55_8]|nr:MAG: hypothetical protein A2X94_09225 [Bdellovibrionales bacterium GWB1_55_8]